MASPKSNADGATHIGEVIKAARVKLGLRVVDVAPLCRVTRGRYYQWEKAQFILPKNHRALSQTLNIPLQRLRSANGKKSDSRPG